MDLKHLQEIKERLAVATEGPWPDNGTDSWRWVGMSRAQIQRNRKFIAHARQDVEDLVAAVEELMGPARFIVTHRYQFEAGGVLPILVTKRERQIIDMLGEAMYGFPQLVEFTEVQDVGG